MDVEIKPSLLKGTISVPPSKSISHRALICASLARGKSVIRNVLHCSDIDATIDVMTALGSRFDVHGNDITVYGIEKTVKNAEALCNESGSTLRFLMPVTAALGTESIFYGAGKLPERPVTPYFTELGKNGIIFDSKTMPYKIRGSLKSGTYSLSGDISSQFVSGLLFALPILHGKSKILLLSPLESRPYADMTISCLHEFGIDIEMDENSFCIKGDQEYKAREYEVEGDMSQAAFFLVANALGSTISISNLTDSGLQGDSEILKLTGSYTGNAFSVDAKQIPDLVPILTVLACFSDGVSMITGCKRLRLKESDRLEAISTELNKLGAHVSCGSDYLEIEGVRELRGGVCNSYNDHRIAMSLAIAATRATENVTIAGAECVKKSYPGFFSDYVKLGGNINVINP